jgi:membrane protease YdiL (CAAX protease family)
VPASRSVQLKTAAAWGVLGGISTALLFPYLQALLPTVAASVARAKLPLALIVGIQVVQSGAVLFAMTWLGLYVGAAVGLRSPLFAALFGDDTAPTAQTGRTLAVATLCGLAAGALVLGAQHACLPLLPPPAAGAHTPERWKGLLASFYGGIAEELQCRCFLMGLLARGLVMLRASPRLARGAAVVIAAILFGAGHLSAAASLWGLTPSVVAVTVALNAFVGVVTGTLYTRWGLEHAVVAHFAADLVLHVVAGG